MTIYGKLVAIQYDTLEYINYVFKLVNNDARILHNSEFITCVRFPNWDCKELKIGDIGYILINKIKAGVDTWYDGKEIIPYKYDHMQFVKFIPAGESKKEYIL